MARSKDSAEAAITENAIRDLDYIVYSSLIADLSIAIITIAYVYTAFNRPGGMFVSLNYMLSIIAIITILLFAAFVFFLKHGHFVDQVFRLRETREKTRRARGW